jgi:hypothetical protein
MYDCPTPKGTCPGCGYSNCPGHGSLDDYFEISIIESHNGGVHEFCSAVCIGDKISGTKNKSY